MALIPSLSATATGLTKPHYHCHQQQQALRILLNNYHSLPLRNGRLHPLGCLSVRLSALAFLPPPGCIGPYGGTATKGPHCIIVCFYSTSSGKNTSEKTHAPSSTTSHPPEGSNEEHPPKEEKKNKGSLSMTDIKAMSAIELKRLYNQMTLRNIVALCGVVVLVFLLVWVFSDQFKRFFGNQTAEVVNITLQNEIIQVKAKDLSKDIVNQLLEHYSKDEETRKRTTDFIKRILEDPKTTQSVLALSNEVLNNPEFQSKLTTIAQLIAGRVLNDKATLDEVVRLMQRVMAENQTEETFKELVNALLNDERVMTEVEWLAAEVVASDVVTCEVNIIAEKTSSKLLENPELVQKMSKFLQDSVADETLQEAVGYALWESIKIALIPALFRPSPVSSPQPTTPSPSPSVPVTPTPPLLTVPPENLDAFMQGLFRRTYESIESQYGNRFTTEGLLEKKQALKAALLAVRTQYQSCNDKFSDKFMAFIHKNFEDVFKCEHEVIDLGGEGALEILAKTKINKKIEVYKKHLNDMEKLEKGYFWNTYKPAQLKERETIEKAIGDLELEKADVPSLIKKEIASMPRFRVQDMYDGPLEVLWEEKKDNTTTTRRRRRTSSSPTE